MIRAEASDNAELKTPRGYQDFLSLDYPFWPIWWHGTDVRTLEMVLNHLFSQFDVVFISRFEDVNPTTSSVVLTLVINMLFQKAPSTLHHQSIQKRLLDVPV